MPTTATIRRAAPRRAFTLIEVVIAITLSLGLAGTAMWFYRHVGEIRASSTEQIRKINARRQVMDRITDRLRGALAYQLLNLGMEGETDHVTFVTSALPGMSSWAVTDPTKQPVAPEQDLRMVSYQLRIVEDDDGVAYIAGLETSVQKLIMAQVAEEGGGIQSVLLSPDVLFVRFQYWDGTAWQPQWQEKTLPQAIEIAVGDQPLPEGVEPVDYPYELSRRVVYLPGAAGAQPTGTIIRGLGGGTP